MDPRLSDYVERVRGLCGASLSSAARTEAVRAAAAELVARPVRIGPELRLVPPEGYGRNLIYRDPTHGFVVIALVWPSGCGTPPHDHGVWGVVAVAEGRIRVTNFLREDDGTAEGVARLAQRNSFEAGPGAVAATLPPHEDIHIIANPFDETALTLHTYAADLRTSRVFDTETGTTSVRQLTYTNTRTRVRSAVPPQAGGSAAGGAWPTSRPKRS